MRADAQGHEIGAQAPLLGSAAPPRDPFMDAGNSSTGQSKGRTVIATYRIKSIDRVIEAGLIVLCANRVKPARSGNTSTCGSSVSLKRPNFEMRLKVLHNHLAGTGLAEKDLAELAEALGETKGCDYGYTFSDIRQWVIPSLVLEAYPKPKITKALALSNRGQSAYCTFHGRVIS